jgi:hypothetical protein
MSSHVTWSPIAPTFMAILCRQQGIEAAIGINCDNGHVAHAAKQRKASSPAVLTQSMRYARS